MAGFRWVDEEVTILRDMVDKCATIGDILEVFPHRSKASVGAKLEELGLVLKSKTPINLTAYEKFLASVKEQEKVICLK